MAYRRYSAAYVAQEDAAKRAKRGIWAGRSTAPWDWRKGARAMDMGMAAPGGPDGPIPSPKTPPATAAARRSESACPQIADAEPRLLNRRADVRPVGAIP